MNFQIPSCVMRWLGPAIISCIGLLLIFGNPLSTRALCDGTGNCPATWVGALSGWAALIGALLTIGVLRQQLSEQRRQNDHLRGDSSPEVFFEASAHHQDNRYYCEVRVTVINRNRRPLSLFKLEMTAPIDLDLFIRNVTIDGQEPSPIHRMLAKSKYIHQLLMGKEEGHKAERCLIECLVTKAEKLVELPRDADEWEEIKVSITISGFLKDAEDTPISLQTSGVISL